VARDTSPNVLVIRIGICTVNVGDKRSLAIGPFVVRVQLRSLVVRVTGQIGLCEWFAECRIKRLGKFRALLDPHWVGHLVPRE